MVLCPAMVNYIDFDLLKRAKGHEIMQMKILKLKGAFDEVFAGLI